MIDFDFRGGVVRITAVVVLTVASGAGCSSGNAGSDGIVWQEDLPTRDTSWEEFRAARTVADASGKPRYVVADDLFSSEEADLRAYYESYYVPRVQKATGVKVQATGAWNKWANPALTYCVASSTHWGSTSKRNYIKALMVEAAKRWKAEANITWTEQTFSGTTCETWPTTTPPTFAVIKDATKTTGGHSFMPNWSTNERRFWVGTNIFNLTGFSNFVANGETLVDLLDVPFFMHELGHIGGLDHEFGNSGWVPPDPTITTNCTDLAPLNKPSSGFVNADLTAVDYCSIMAYQTPCNYPSGFFATNCAGIIDRKITTQDGFGMRTLYGGPMIWTTVIDAPLL